jgi:hypothetical protein
MLLHVDTHRVSLCMYVCMYVCDVCMYVCMYACVLRYVAVWPRLGKHVYVCVHVCVCMYAYTCMLQCRYVPDTITCACTHKLHRAYVHFCTHEESFNIHAHAHAYIFIHTTNMCHGQCIKPVYQLICFFCTPNFMRWPIPPPIEPYASYLAVLYVCMYVCMYYESVYVYLYVCDGRIQQPITPYMQVT